MALDEATRTMLDELVQRFGSGVVGKEPLSRHGTFGVGGPADAWLAVTKEEMLIELAALATERRWPLMLVGNGTNVLYADAGARGIVARMHSASWHIDDIDSEHALLVADGGVDLPKLANVLATQGLAGLEWGAGVPGTVGGAVVSNAGANGACLADTLKSARVLFTGEGVVRELSAEELQLGYRHSRFRAARRVVFGDDGQPTAAPRALIEPAEMITGATFLLTRDDPAAVRGRVMHHLKYRKETQPTQKSAGSVFKNPLPEYSGRLIEAAGLKGRMVGKAQISARHANFIVNTGGATAADVVSLIALARRTVREQFGIELELELELRGDW
ncbi:MAG TPA: UDP-N-acetylmuramate dehydrogenase [Ktedonobacterales bacterium]|nr:UDP-N-acetylmuramate dehydrogenase [Ktedonobacterales bacterium]